MTTTDAEAREQRFPLVNREGACRIQEVNKIVLKPVLARVTTYPQDEVLAVLRYDVLVDLEQACRHRSAVQLTIVRDTLSHERCVVSVRDLPSGLEQGWPCLRCETTALREDTDPITYRCPSCHALIVLPPRLVDPPRITA